MHYDHIVVGAGTMGMAAGYFLAREGKNVLLLDAFQPPHAEGSHHGETRLIRFAYGEGEQYVPFVLRAFELFKELESLSGKEIFRRVGVLNIGHKHESFLKNIMKSSEQYDLPIEHLSHKEVNARWEGLRLTEGMEACFEPNSGVLFSERVIAAYKELAVKEGAELVGNDRVVAIEPSNDQAKVVTESGASYTAESVVITVGAWGEKLFETMHVQVPVTPIRKCFAWYEADESVYGDAVFPGFTYSRGEVQYYGFPSIDGAGLKIGRHDLGDEVDPDEPLAPFGEVAGDREHLDDFLARIMPKTGPLKFGKTCMYNMTPDHHFIIDRLPGYENIVMATGFSGHGFKFASAVGEALKDMVLEEKPKVDLRPFSLERFG